MTSRAWMAGLVVGLCGGAAQATDVALVANGAWNSFAVDSALAAPSNALGWIDDAGGALGFTFSIPSGATGTLTVVDAGFAGDRFAVTNFGTTLGMTSAVPAGTFESSANVGLNFDGALANAAFSRGVFTLGGGTYRISGLLTQSVTFAGEPLDATAGAVRLTVTAIPEPDVVALFAGGLAFVGFVSRRRLS